MQGSGMRPEALLWAAVRRAPLVSWLLAVPLAAAAIAVGQLDDFEDLTAQGWHQSGGVLPQVPLTVTANGGPLGVGDAYATFSGTGGIGSGSRMTANNRSAGWLGDYTAAGVARIRLDVRNPNAFAVTVRLAFEGAAVSERAVTTVGQVVPAASGWTTLTLDVGAGDLTALGIAPAATTLTGVTLFRVLHNPAIAFEGAAVSGSLDIDNVRTLPPAAIIPAVQSPGLLVLIAVLSLAGVYVLHRRSAA